MDIAAGTYSISQDIASGTLDLSKLDAEVRASDAVSGFSGLTTQGDTLTVHGTVLDQAALDAVIHGHAALSLAEKKAAKVLAIDSRTRAIISAGFSFDGSQFSLSQQAQTNWLGLSVLQDLLSWPMGITNNADATYALSLENLVPFLASGSGVIATAVGTGRALKIAANAASTQGELDAVVDSR